MFGIVVEASHQRGMGHLFRMLNFAETLIRKGIGFRFFINDDLRAQAILQQAGRQFDVVKLDALGWQGEAIDRYALNVWIDDMLDTSLSHAQEVQAAGIPRVTFDDHGPGAALANLNIAALCFGESATNLKGQHILLGPRYLILNPEIDQYRKLRQRLDSIVISMGGSDTYGVTVQVVSRLKRMGRGATVILGPGFQHEEEIKHVLDDGFVVKRNVPSLAQEFSRHDLAITGGGVTPFEANAAGLPCVVIANEDFEVSVGLAIEAMGGAVFAGYHKRFSLSSIESGMPLQRMSQAGMEKIDLRGVSRVLDAIVNLL